jgi:hypothetical protein
MGDVFLFIFSLIVNPVFLMQFEALLPQVSCFVRYSYFMQVDLIM